MSEVKNISEPTKQPVAARKASEATTADTKPQEQESNIPQWVPTPVKNVAQSISDKMGEWRTSTILATPAFVLNNSSNILGAAHVGTEILMIKSGMKGARLVDNPENPINWVVQPAQKIYADILTTKDYSPLTLLKGNPIKNFRHFVMDTHDASLRELGRQTSGIGTALKKVSFGNPWQTRTTGMGILIWTLSALIPEKKESDEEIERMAKKRTLNPLGYVAERFKQAIWFPDWRTHKREMLGLGYLCIGVLSGLGAWRNRGDLAPELKLTKNTPLAEAEEKLGGYVKNIRAEEAGGKIFGKSVLKNVALIEEGLKKGAPLIQGYKFNMAYFATAIVSLIGGISLMFALDERKAYSTYGSMVFFRVPLLPASIGEKIRNRESGWLSYSIGKILFQIEDSIFMLIGGAEKRKKPDGTYEVIDHEKLKKEAIREAKEEKARAKEEKHSVRPHVVEHPEQADLPAATITAPAQPERAMPERVVAAANDARIAVAAGER